MAELEFNSSPPSYPALASLEIMCLVLTDAAASENRPGVRPSAKGRDGSKPLLNSSVSRDPVGAWSRRRWLPEARKRVPHLSW